MKNPTVYIMANKPGGVLYTGVTADLARRVWQHRTGLGSRFDGYVTALLARARAR